MRLVTDDGAPDDDTAPWAETCHCGSAIFDARIAIGDTGKVVGYRLPLKCAECGAEYTPRRDRITPVPAEQPATLTDEVYPTAGGWKKVPWR